MRPPHGEGLSPSAMGGYATHKLVTAAPPPVKISINLNSDSVLGGLKTLGYQVSLKLKNFEKIMDIHTYKHTLLKVNYI